MGMALPLSMGFQGGAMSDKSEDEGEGTSIRSAMERQFPHLDASSGGSRLADSEPASQPTELQKKGEEAIASDDTFVQGVDVATGAVKLNRNMRSFGTKVSVRLRHG
jgi:hypothetical protein